MRDFEVLKTEDGYDIVETKRIYSFSEPQRDMILHLTHDEADKLVADYEALKPKPKVVPAVATEVPPISVTISGSIDSGSGTCPELALKVGPTYVRTDAKTVFVGKPCAQLIPGISVTVAGVRQSDGAVLATTVTSQAVAKQMPPAAPAAGHSGF